MVILLRYKTSEFGSASTDEIQTLVACLTWRRLQELLAEWLNQAVLLALLLNTTTKVYHGLKSPAEEEVQGMLACKGLEQKLGMTQISVLPVHR